METFNLTNLIHRITHIGVNDELPVSLRKKIIVNHQVALIFGLLVAVPFIVITFIYFKPILLIPILAFVGIMAVFPLSHFGAYDASRIFNSLYSFTLGFIYIAYISQDGNPVGNIFIFTLSFALTPFLVFNIQEKVKLGAIITYMIIMFMITDKLNTFFYIELDISVLESGFLGKISLLVAVISSFAIVAAMASINNRNEMEMEELMDKQDDQVQKLNDSELELKKQLEEIELSKVKEQQRIWISDGIAILNDIIRTNEEEAKTFDALVVSIVKHLNANQAGLFVVNREDNETFIDLKACYAYDRKKYVDKRILPGQGLLGQTYMEKAYNLYTDIPNNYVSITSGLGEATPTSLIIVPFIMNEEVFGLIEIASFDYFEDFHIEYLEKVAESLASFINSNKLNVVTKTLYEEAKIAREELEMQKEELRQTMEELEANNEELARKENEYIKEIEKLKANSPDKPKIAGKNRPEQTDDGFKQVA